MQMAVAYATFANGGHRIEPHIVDEVYDIDGRRILKSRHPVVCDNCETWLEPIDLASLPGRRGGSETVPAGGVATAPGAEPTTLADVLANADRGPGTDAAAGPAGGDLDTPIAAQRVIDERVAYVMHSMLQT